MILHRFSMLGLQKLHSSSPDANRVPLACAISPLWLRADKWASKVRWVNLIPEYQQLWLSWVAYLFTRPITSERMMRNPIVVTLGAVQVVIPSVSFDGYSANLGSTEIYHLHWIFCGTIELVCVAFFFRIRLNFTSHTRHSAPWTWHFRKEQEQDADAALRVLGVK